MSNPVLRAIANPLGDPALDVFLHWCDLKGVRPIPISPAVIAGFVVGSQALGIDKIAATVSAISQAHMSRGLADPTAGGPVAAAINQIAPVTPPRSWKKEAKEAFATLPYGLQIYIAERDSEDTAEIKRAQNEVAGLRNELKKQKEENDGIQQGAAA